MACRSGDRPAEGSKRLALQASEESDHGETAKPLDHNPPREAPAKRPWFRGNAVVAGSPMLRFRYTEERIYPGDGMRLAGHRQDLR